MICGDQDGQGPTYFVYRSSKYLTQFFEDLDTDYTHDGSTRADWVARVIGEMVSEDGAYSQGRLAEIVRRLMDREEAIDEDRNRHNALARLNGAFERERLQAFYGDDGQCYLRDLRASSKVVIKSPDPHKQFSHAESQRRDRLSKYLDSASEDQLIEDVLVPLFRSLGFERVTASGHVDKAQEYGKDLWMRFRLPTRHYLYFGIQAKRDRLDSAGSSRGRNIAEIHNQLLMMIGHEIFDPEVNRRVLVDHAIIVAGGQITKAARAWIGNALDASRRSQVMFMDRDDILNLFAVSNVPLPER